MRNSAGVPRFAAMLVAAMAAAAPADTGEEAGADAGEGGARETRQIKALPWPSPVGIVPSDAEVRVDADGKPMWVETPLGLILSEPGVSEGFILFSNGSAGTFLLDIAGQVAYQWEHALTNARLLPNGNVIGTQGKYIYEMDRDSKPAWEYEPPLPMHHDYLKLPNGNVLMLLTRRRTAEEVIAAGANPEFIDPERGLAFDVLVEVRPAYPIGGEIVWEWSVWDHLIQDFDPEKGNYGDVAAHPERVDLNYALPELSRTSRVPDRSDWAYANAIDYRADLDQVLISARNFSEVWVVDHSTTRQEAAASKGGRSGRGGDLLYRWGNPRTYRAGTTAQQQLFWPHSAHWIPEGLPGAGNILVFSNGAEFEGLEQNHSAVVEFEYPVARGEPKPVSGKPGEALPPAGPVWRHVADPPESFFSRRTSSVQRLANGNTLVLAGLQGTMFEVTPAGKTIWQYVNPLDASMALAQGDPMPILLRRRQLVWANLLFRVRKYAPDHPGLKGLDLASKGTLERSRDNGASRIVAREYMEPQ